MREERRERREDKEQERTKDSARGGELKRCHGGKKNKSKGIVDDGAKRGRGVVRDGRTKGAVGKEIEEETMERGKREMRRGRSRRLTERHLRVSLLVGYLQEVKGVPQGGLLQGQGEGQGELLRQAARKHLTGTMQETEKFRRCQLQPGNSQIKERRQPKNG